MNLCCNVHAELNTMIICHKTRYLKWIAFSKQSHRMLNSTARPQLHPRSSFGSLAVRAAQEHLMLTLNATLLHAWQSSEIRTLRTWYPSDPPPGISTLWDPPMALRFYLPVIKLYFPGVSGLAAARHVGQVFLVGWMKTEYTCAVTWQSRKRGWRDSSAFAADAQV